ncbi:MAG: hypothetical protein N2C12_05325 [Planctomycetales bacterium]
MLRASQLIKEEDYKQVRSAVEEAEAKTSAEIVPVVATSSGRYDRPEDMYGLWLAVLAAIAVWLFVPPVDADNAWGGWTVWMQLVVLVVAMVVAFILGAVIASRLLWIRRLLTPKKQMQEEVQARARSIFFDSRVHHTAGATGLLIYVSLYEHLAYVLADKEILDKAGERFPEELCQLLTAELQRGTVINAICTAVTEAGNRLADPLPRAGEDVNELEDALIVLDD